MAIIENAGIKTVSFSHIFNAANARINADVPLLQDEPYFNVWLAANSCSNALTDSPKAISFLVIASMTASISSFSIVGFATYIIRSACLFSIGSFI